MKQFDTQIKKNMIINQRNIIQIKIAAKQIQIRGFKYVFG